MRAPNTRLALHQIALSALVAVFVLAGLSFEAHAASITGNWRGAGVVNLKSGGKEKVRCTVTYGRAGGQNFSVDARCASGAGRVDQTGVLTRKSNSRYVGTVRNAQYSVTATVTVKVNGKKQTVHISSSEGTANLQLTRR